ncbi:MAG: hypothetical protein ACJ76Z_10065 [Thermoleophilaceae bacterium]
MAIGFGALAAPAHATFHLEKVNEVMLASAGGDPSVQFVELLDHGGTEEQFTPVFAPYKLVVYDGAGNKLGEHVLTASGLSKAAAADGPYLISTAPADAAFGVKGDEVLDMPLPQAAGQACFEANAQPSAFNCMTWGPITKAVATNSNGTGSAQGPLPPPGQSDQRQADDSVVAASPTPKAANRSGVTGAPAPAFAGVSFAARTVTVDSRGRALVRLTCPAGAKDACSGRLTLTAHARTLARASFAITAGKTVTVRAMLSRRARAQLARDHRLRATGTAVARDGSDASKTTKARLRLVRKRSAPAPQSSPPGY